MVIRRNSSAATCLPRIEEKGSTQWPRALDSSIASDLFYAASPIAAGRSDRRLIISPFPNENPGSRPHAFFFVLSSTPCHISCPGIKKASPPSRGSTDFHHLKSPAGSPYHAIRSHFVDPKTYAGRFRTQWRIVSDGTCAADILCFLIVPPLRQNI